MRLLTAADWIMAVTTLNSVADYLLCCAVLCCALLRNVMAPLKLQKMGLYVDAWCMVLNDGEALIAERFEAWVHGPSARDLCILLAVYNW